MYVKPEISLTNALANGLVELTDAGRDYMERREQELLQQLVCRKLELKRLRQQAVAGLAYRKLHVEMNEAEKKAYFEGDWSSLATQFDPPSGDQRVFSENQVRAEMLRLLRCEL